MNKNIRTFTCKLFNAFALFSLTIMVMSSCKSEGTEPENIAETFLTAYLSTDFNKAATCCTGVLSEELKEAVKEFETLDESLKKSIMASSAQLVPKINSVEKIGKGDTLVVNYSLVKSTPDSTANTNTDIIQSYLSLVKDEAVGWKVSKLNK